MQHSVQVVNWLLFALQGADALEDPVTERQQDENVALIVSALLQSMLLVISVVYILDNTEAVAKQLEALAPGTQEAAADDGAHPCIKWTSGTGHHRDSCSALTMWVALWLPRACHACQANNMAIQQCTRAG